MNHVIDLIGWDTYNCAVYHFEGKIMIGCMGNVQCMVKMLVCEQDVMNEVPTPYIRLFNEQDEWEMCQDE